MIIIILLELFLKLSIFFNLKVTGLKKIPVTASSDLCRSGSSLFSSSVPAAPGVPWGGSRGKELPEEVTDA